MVAVVQLEVGSNPRPWHLSQRISSEVGTVARVCASVWPEVLVTVISATW